MSINRKKAIPLDPKNFLIMPAGRLVPDDEIAREIREGRWAYVEGLSRQTAHAAAKRLSRKLRVTVISSAAFYQNKKGYVFYQGKTS